MTTPNQDIKYVKNIAKTAEGLSETEIKELETVSEKDNIIKDMDITPIPGIIPSPEEIKKMEKIEVIQEEEMADANFPSVKDDSSGRSDCVSETIEETNQDSSSDGISTNSEDDINSEELEKILKEFDNIDITIEDIKAEKSKSTDFKEIELTDSAYGELINVYRKLNDSSNADVLELLSDDIKSELLIQANKIGVNTKDTNIYKFFIEGFIREICGDALLEKGKNLVNNAIKKVTNTSNSKELTKMVEDFIEKSYNDRITKMNNIINSTSDPNVRDECNKIIEANYDAKEYNWIYSAIDHKPSYFNLNKAFKSQERNVNDIHLALHRLNINNINVGVFMDAIYEFTETTTETSAIFAILVEVINKNTNVSDKADMLRLYTMMLLLSGALHAVKTKKSLSGLFEEVAFNFQLLCNTISAGFNTYKAQLNQQTNNHKNKKCRK